MTIQFPNNLDTLTNPTGTDEVAVVSHAGQHADANDAIEALEAKVGVDGSAVTSTHDYKLSSVADGDKVADGATLTAHTSNTSNPHAVTAEQLSVDTTATSDAKLGLKADKANVLELDNTTAFTPTADYQPATKKFVEDYVESTGKESVGLFTQGKFIDSIETNLKFSKKQPLTTSTLSGLVGSNLDTLDELTWLAMSEDNFREYTLSGTTFTNTQTLTLSSYQGDAHEVVKYIDSTNAISAGKVSSGFSVNTYVKSGTWAVDKSVTITGLPNYSDSFVTDIWVQSSTEFYISFRESDNLIRVYKFLIGGGNIYEDGSWSKPEFTDSNDISWAKFQSNTEMFIQRITSGFVGKYNFSSGSIAITGNEGAMSTYFAILSNDKVIDTAGHTYDFDGTDWSQVSDTATAMSGFSPVTSCIVSPTVIYDTNSKFVLGVEGLEDSIEDLNASGYLGYIISNSNTNTGTTSNSGIVISESSNNDGTYSVDSFTADKVVLNSSTTVSVEETEVARISANLANMERWAWSVKNGNYYLRLES